MSDNLGYEIGKSNFLGRLDFVSNLGSKAKSKFSQEFPRRDE
jgi:hypothetical protein